MAAVDVVVLVAAVVACVAAIVGVAAAVVLVGQVRRLERGIEALRGEAVPLVAEASQAVDHASSEMARVEAVLEDTESVTATVDSASKLAQRAFANPVVKVLAFRPGRPAGCAGSGTGHDQVGAGDDEPSGLVGGRRGPRGGRHAVGRAAGPRAQAAQA